jgi:ribosomal protein L3 glutamine methyltransferase
MEVGALRKAIDAEFASLRPHWLRTQDGQYPVCVIQAEALRRWSPK